MTPTHTTANQHLLFATPGYFALSGVPPADYNLGVNNFFSTSGDTLNWAGVSLLTFTAGQLPTDGVRQIERAFNGTALTTDTSSPTNFRREHRDYWSTHADSDTDSDTHTNPDTDADSYADADSNTYTAQYAGALFAASSPAGIGRRDPIHDLPEIYPPGLGIQFRNRTSEMTY